MSEAETEGDSRAPRSVHQSCYNIRLSAEISRIIFPQREVLVIAVLASDRTSRAGEIADLSGYLLVASGFNPLPLPVALRATTSRYENTWGTKREAPPIPLTTTSLTITSPLMRSGESGEGTDRAGEYGLRGESSGVSRWRTGEVGRLRGGGQLSSARLRPRGRPSGPALTSPPSSAIWPLKGLLCGGAQRFERWLYPDAQMYMHYTADR